MAEEDEDYFLPVQDQRVFGAGIKRKRIAFVPASISESSIPTTKPQESTNIASRYLSIVLPKESRRVEERDEKKAEQVAAKTCAVCKQPLSSSNENIAAIDIHAHESSIAHQVCVQHSYPPSHLDREHVGVRYLEAYGWDPDSRAGLGARQEGIRIPIKPKEKHDTAGLREIEEDDSWGTRTKIKVKKQDKVIRLDAKKVRVMDMEAKKRAEKLRKSFYGPDLEKYLGPNS
ncbi:hypothetical protein LTR10_020814 [Elasticomyces elasticus]|uniref:G-patch domain-containing protein n=1 Tax=Exophiala sideris TaxID=1016849 RepID=A0ABR0JHM0_9EURO|nr:hypothetical protein LTR10_020814 [Elasticomyces elasticus]KAK5034096.1 hypothetical protein LTS07_003016 [Exophiala sideris]KAK5042392.1 hypothetical protein LTR13_001239 [Exophiala sideris]KAK5065473.1 hypothetical protein LTR69_003022 [Exophiala sideris]KAK5186067.1 hypothetical protein LTR44_002116 [Eurotiomycetes sp. CCFEE 6388]